MGKNQHQKQTTARQGPARVGRGGIEIWGRRGAPYNIQPQARALRQGAPRARRRSALALEGRRRAAGGGNLPRRQRERDRALGRRPVDVRPPGRRRRPGEAAEAPVDQLDRCEHASSSRSRISAPSCGLGAGAGSAWGGTGRIAQKITIKPVRKNCTKNNHKKKLSGFGSMVHFA